MHRAELACLEPYQKQLIWGGLAHLLGVRAVAIGGRKKHGPHNRGKRSQMQYITRLKSWFISSVLSELGGRPPLELGFAGGCLIC
jgi:hypothetical protein